MDPRLEIHGASLRPPPPWRALPASSTQEQCTVSSAPHSLLVSAADHELPSLCAEELRRRWFSRVSPLLHAVLHCSRLVTIRCRIRFFFVPPGCTMQARWRGCGIRLLVWSLAFLGSWCIPPNEGKPASLQSRQPTWGFSGV